MSKPGLYRAVEILYGGAIPAVLKQCEGNTEEGVMNTPGQGRKHSCRSRHSPEGIWRQEQHDQKHGDKKWGEAVVCCGLPTAQIEGGNLGLCARPTQMPACVWRVSREQVLHF